MEKLLKLAQQAADQAEIYYTQSSQDGIDFNDGKLDKADSSFSSGIALRIIKDGKMGLAHTRNLLDPDALVKQALQSAENGVNVNFHFPYTKDVKELDMYRKELESLSKPELIGMGKEIVDYVRSRVDGQVNVGFGYGTMESRVINSAGTSLGRKSGEFVVHCQIIFPGTGSGLFTFKVAPGLVKLDKDALDEIIELFILSKTEIVPPTAKMPVIFTPFAVPALLSRFGAASAPINIYNGISPLCNKFGEKIVSEKFSLWQDPHDPEMTDSVAFDTEGTPTRRLDFISKGIFNTIATDLNYAEKLNREATGNGFRYSVEGLPTAMPINLCIGTGHSSLQDMIAGVKEGIIVQSLMGAHSGNVLNGDYSVGVSTGFMIKNGVITGRVKDCLLSGNAYETLSNIIEIEDKQHNFGSQKIPSILCADVSVAGK